MVATAGYELLISAASSLTDTAVLAVDTEPSLGDAKLFLRANQNVLDLARTALQHNCAVPLRYEADFFQTHCENYSLLRDLALGFALELATAVRIGHFSHAVDITLNIFDLANAVRRGGLIVDALVASTIAGIGVEKTRAYHRRLGIVEANRLANGLLRCDAAREPFEDILARDRKWEETVEDPSDHGDLCTTEWPDPREVGLDEDAAKALQALVQWFADLPDDERHALEHQLDDRSVTMIRLLAIEAGVTAYRGENGLYPSELLILVPDYIVAIPRDPYTGVDFKYRRGASGFVVYSPGPTGQDSGGHFGSWCSVVSGEADLGVDMCDYQDEC